MCSMKGPKAPAPAPAPAAPPPPPEAIAETVAVSDEDKMKTSSVKNSAGRTGLTIQRSAVASTGGAGAQV